MATVMKKLKVTKEIKLSVNSPNKKADARRKKSSYIPNMRTMSNVKPSNGF